MQKFNHSLPLARAAAMSMLALCCVLSGCDKGDANKDADRELSIKEGDARATGSACRQAGRALEDCYTLNPESARASVFTGWKDMNDYMRENKIEDVKPIIEKPKPAGSTSESKDRSSRR